MINQFRITDDEQRDIRRILLEIAQCPENIEERTFLDHAVIFAHELPRRIREVFYEFKLRESYSVLLLTSNPVVPDDIGPTPKTHWRQEEERPLNFGQLLHGLYSSLLGEPFGFETQQRGRIFNDLIPIPGALDNSSSGNGKVGLHTEDYSKTQPYMPDYLGLMCLRNAQHVATTISSLENINIPDNIRRMLFEQHFPYRNSLHQTVLFGDSQRPYLRYGAIDTEKCNNEMVTAMTYLSDALYKNQQKVTMKQGDCLYLDNFVAVHGREPFKVEYGENGRWFSRLCIIRDLRRIRSFMSAPEARVIPMNKHESSSRISPSK